MKQLEINEIRKLQLDILDSVSEFCDKNNISYWLDHGTLIGAVRHKGYIPWDDDIDIGMLREDYERFIKSYSADNYFVLSLLSDKHHFNAFAKICDNRTVLEEGKYRYCVSVDLFPYDNAPSDINACKKTYKKRDRLVNLWKYSQADNKIHGMPLSVAFKYLRRFLLKLIGPDYFVRKIDKNAKRFYNNESEYVADYTGQSYFHIKKSDILPVIKAPFEGKYYKIPSGYDLILKGRYGDYMQLPPVEEQVNKHEYKAYMK